MIIDLNRLDQIRLSGTAAVRRGAALRVLVDLVVRLGLMLHTDDVQRVSIRLG